MSFHTPMTAYRSTRQQQYVYMINYRSCINAKWKKRSEETQTLRAGCSKMEPKFFAPPQTPFPGVWDSQNLINWRRSLPLPTNPVWWGSMHAISSYHGNRPTNTHAHPQTGPITIHCTAASLVCSVIIGVLVDERHGNPPPKWPGAISGQRQSWKTHRWAWSKQVHGMWYFPFSAVTLFVGWQEGHQACKKILHQQPPNLCI